MFKSKQILNVNDLKKNDENIFIVDGSENKVNDNKDFSDITIKDFISLSKKINSNNKFFTKDLNFQLELKKKRFNEFKVNVFFFVLMYFENLLLSFNILKKLWFFFCKFLGDVNIFFIIILSFLFFLLFL